MGEIFSSLYNLYMEAEAFALNKQENLKTNIRKIFNFNLANRILNSFKTTNLHIFLVT